MYSRNSLNGIRYSPPPGYAGNTISDEGRLKHHPPSDELKRSDVDEARQSQSLRDESDVKTEPPQKECIKPKERDIIEEVFSLLKEKFGSEELIILAVMLLIAQNGIGAEVLILALLLIAG